MLTDVSISPTLLKQRVCMAIEAEIQAEVMEYELSDDDYLEISNRFLYFLIKLDIFLTNYKIIFILDVGHDFIHVVPNIMLPEHDLWAFYYYHLCRD